MTTKHSILYTRTGDTGHTSLVGGRRVHKTHARLEAYGTLDELNAFIGLLMAELRDEALRNFLTTTQSHLFSLGSQLATDPRDTPHPCSVTEETVQELEQAIDTTDAPSGPWRGFILPAGTRGASLAHVCRTVTRRLERRMYALADEGLPAPTLFRYVNRLSDYFFALAKELNRQANVEEKYWRTR